MDRQSEPSHRRQIGRKAVRTLASAGIFRVKENKSCRVRPSWPPEQEHPLGNNCLLQPRANAANSLSVSLPSYLLRHKSYPWKTMTNCSSSLGLSFLSCTMGGGPSLLEGWWAVMPQHGSTMSLGLVQSRHSTSKPEMISAASSWELKQNQGFSSQHPLQASYQGFKIH